MKIRFGFVAMSTILKDVSPAKTMQLSYLRRNIDSPEIFDRILSISKQNLENTLELLRHAHSLDIHMYRFSSKLLPLLGTPETSHVDYFGELKESFLNIGNFVKEQDMRVSFHPAQFTVLNSPKEQVVANSIADLQHHIMQLEAMGLDNRTKMVLHVGGAYGDKPLSLSRFKENWNTIVPQNIKERLILENDDKTFTAKEVLSLCQDIGVPMVFDTHHHNCNNDGEKLGDLVPSIFETWKDTGINPKVHISSPKNEKESRSHHDYINVDDIMPFLNVAREVGKDIDIMIEAKQKDTTLLKLTKELSDIKGFTQIDTSTLIY